MQIQSLKRVSKANKNTQNFTVHNFDQVKLVFTFVNMSKQLWLYNILNNWRND